jgi:branched-chain amino acid transport system substrate-binding protein
MDSVLKKFSFPLLALFLFMMWPEAAPSQPPLRMGALIPFSGRWGDSGRESAKGMLDAGKWLNQRGGIFGRKLEILLIEDTSQTAEIMAAYRKFNEADHIPLLYIYSTETSLALLPHIHFDRIPTLASSLPSDRSNPSKYPYLFAITPTPLDLSKIAMKFISERSGIKVRKPKIVFVGSPTHLGRHFLEEAKAYAKASGLDIGPDIRIPEFSQSGEPASADVPARSISSVLAGMTSYDPDFAYLSLTSKEAFFVLREARKMGLKTRWVCNRRAFDENLTPFDGVLGVQPISPFGENVPGMAEIKEAHQKWHPYDSHTLSYVEGWATAQAIAEVLGRSLPEQRLSRERVKSSLESLKDFVLGGLVPPITITPNDHRPSVESRIFTIKEGKIVRYTSFISLGRSGKE